MKHQIVVVIIAIVPAVACSQASFQGLGALSGGLYSRALGVSASGTYVVGQSASSNGLRAFRWSNEEGMQDLGKNASVANAVSGDGSVVAGWTDGNSAFRWTNDDGIQDLGASSGSQSNATAISGDGATIVGYYGTRAFRWTSTGGFQDLESLPGGLGGDARGVSWDGSTIVGYSGSSLGTRAVRWTGTAIQDLGVLSSGVGSYALGVSGDGSTVVGFADVPTGLRAFRWTNEAGIQNLGALSGDLNSKALAISGDGSTIVGEGDSSAFLWREDLGMVNLQSMLVSQGVVAPLDGWHISSATSVTVANGKIYVTGYGYNSSVQQSQAFLATLRAPVPEPATVLCYVTVGGGLWVRRAFLRKRRR